jgi:hypothetical protein
MEKKLKHLEFIQNVITRMNTNSFLIKGWSVTLVSALFALAAKDANMRFMPISFIAILAFWILDGFFLATERRYRALYEEVRHKDEKDIDFSMNAEKFNCKYTWRSGVFSNTLILFYLISIASALFVLLIFFQMK